MNDKKRILILAGGNGNYNIGDDAMFESLIYALRKDNDLYIVTDCWPWWKSDLVEQTIPYISRYNSRYRAIRKIVTYWRFFIAGWCASMFKKFHIKCVDSSLQKHFEIIKDMDIVIFAGMGGMNDDYRLSSHGIISRGIIIKTAKVFNKPVVFSGNGIGPIKRWNLRMISSSYIKDVDKIFVRDKTGSKQTLVSIGYPLEKIVETIDDAFFLNYDQKDITSVDNLLKQNNLNEFVVLNIHNWNKNRADILIDKISQFAQDQLRNENILLTPSCYGKFGDDRIILRKLKEKLNSQGLKNVVLFEEQLTAKQAKYLIGRAKYSLSSRYHIGVFALSQNKPVILICFDEGYYLQKMRGILCWYNLEKYAIKFDKIHELEEKMGEIRSNYKILQEEIGKHNTEFQNKGYLAARYINQKLVG